MVWSMHNSAGHIMRLQFVIYMVGLLFFIVSSDLLSVNDAAAADTFRLPTYYSDHMVLQMEPASAVIWGYADIGADITLTFKDKKYTATAGTASFTTDGVWSVTLDPQTPGGPFTITILSESAGTQEEIVLQDVLFGDVWVCSGQSNMAFDVKDAFNGSEALINSYKYNHVRVLAVEQVYSAVPLYDVQSLYEPWSIPDPESLGGDTANFEYYFSAVCWFFGVDLHNHMEYPVGLISTNWGGTPIESWSAPEVMASCNVSTPKDHTRDATPKKVNRTENSIPSIGDKYTHSALWNAMIHPLLNMTIKGAVWYQGEDNAVDDPSTYNCLFPAMISNWRKKWYMGTSQTDPQFPFGFVQLCNSEFPEPGNANFTALRWHQTADYGYTPNPLLPNVFMAVAIDLPDVKSPHGPVHPRDKEDVSARLLLGARALAYGESYVTFQGPFPSSIQSMPEDQFIVVQFNDGNVPLKVNGLGGFDVCCATSHTDCPIQGNVTWLPSTIVGVMADTTIIIKDTCEGQGSAIRYIWRDLPCEFKKCPLYDAKTLLPVPPFFLPTNSSTSPVAPQLKHNEMKYYNKLRYP